MLKEIELVGHELEVLRHQGCHVASRVVWVKPSRRRLKWARRVRVELCEPVGVVSECGVGARRQVGVRAFGIVAAVKRVEILQDEMECSPVGEGMVKCPDEQRCGRREP